MKLGTYRPNIYTVFCSPGPTHIYPSGSDPKKKSEIQTHPPKAASLWYRVGKKTTFFSLFCFKGKRAFESSSVRATTKRPFLLVLLPKERPLPSLPPLPTPRRRLTATAAMTAVSRCEAGVAPPPSSARRSRSETEGASGLFHIPLTVAEAGF